MVFCTRGDFERVFWYLGIGNGDGWYGMVLYGMVR